MASSHHQLPVTTSSDRERDDKCGSDIVDCAVFAG